MQNTGLTMRLAVLCLALAAMCLASAAHAQHFTTAAEVRPILQATKPNWVSVREYEGQDLVYFTPLLSWRCGLQQIVYGLNGAPPNSVFVMEPCHEGTAAPNAIKSDALYLSLPLGSVNSITIGLFYDDGSTETAQFSRAQVLTR